MREIVLDIKDELVLCLAEHHDAQQKRDETAGQAQNVEFERGEALVEQRLADVSDVVKHGIEALDGKHPVRQDLLGVEERSRIGPGRQHDAPEVHDIPEEDRECAQQQRQAAAEERDIDQEEGQCRHGPRGVDPHEEHDDEHGDQREDEVDNREEDLLDGEDPA